MARARAHPVFDPAGHDDALRTVLQDLRTGRWMAMRALLADTTAWWQWTRRTQVLAAAAAGTDVVRAWLAEEPSSVPATVMYARVAVERALRAHRDGHRRTHELWVEAWDASDTATRTAPFDPVPWVCLIALAQIDREQSWAEHRAAAPEPALPPGPWGLLAEAGKRDPHNREAHHRMLQFLYTRSASGRLTEAAVYAHRAAGAAPLGSALHALPLYVRAERYRRGAGRDVALDLYWVSEDATREARHALHAWFDHSPAAEHSPLDLNHLAHALWGALRFPDAARVFDALGPYCTPAPWSYRTPDPNRAPEVFLQARARSHAGVDGPGTST
ncbi:hypothetical protein ACIPSA_18320 [Streptomyces sp. NPDC086549]|uniref:hypothetical protein n=1 Tax=Streptomyces sp. NPDC086549 TaxID=3365752 RepID=UPI0037FFF7C0